MVMSKCHGSPEEIRRLHPKLFFVSSLSSSFYAISLKYVGASVGEKPVLVKKLPATTTVGKLKKLCESFFKLKSVKPVLFLQEEGSPVPALLNDDMESLVKLGIGNESTILVDDEEP